MFKFIKNKQNNPDIVHKAIIHIEQKYNIVFPDTLKQLYSECESGKIKLSVFDVEGIECEVDSLISVVSKEFCFESITDSDKEDGFIPDTFYPLAINRGGDIYYWDSNNGNIYLVFSDDIENPFMISESIEEFIALIENNIA